MGFISIPLKVIIHYLTYRYFKRVYQKMIESEIIWIKEEENKTILGFVPQK